MTFEPASVEELRAAMLGGVAQGTLVQKMVHEIEVHREILSHASIGALRLYSDELGALRKMRDGMTKLRADIDGDVDCCSWCSEIDELLNITTEKT